VFGRESESGKLGQRTRQTKGGLNHEENSDRSACGYHGYRGIYDAQDDCHGRPQSQRRDHGGPADRNDRADADDQQPDATDRHTRVLRGDRARHRRPGLGNVFAASGHESHLYSIGQRDHRPRSRRDCQLHRRRSDDIQHQRGGHSCDDAHFAHRHRRDCSQSMCHLFRRHRHPLHHRRSHVGLSERPGTPAVPESLIAGNIGLTDIVG